MGTSKEASRIQRQRTDVWSQLPGFGQPMPSAHDFAQGIAHHSDKAEHKDKLWDVVRAIASNKLYFQEILWQQLEEADSASG